MLNYFTYTVCQSCFDGMVESGSFRPHGPISVMDQIGDDVLIYILDQNIEDSECYEDVHEA